MTQEQKEKAYDEAVQEAYIAYKDGDRHLKAILERIFPELKGSEDERIRKAIMEFFELARINNSNALKGKKQSKESVEKRAKTLQKSIGKKVNQFALDGSFIRSFNSFNEAARITGIWEASIRNCCIGKYQHAGGYIWNFPEVTFENSPQEVELKLVK